MKLRHIKQKENLTYFERKETERERKTDRQIKNLNRKVLPQQKRSYEVAIYKTVLEIRSYS